jgi:hypothetical protein
VASGDYSFLAASELSIAAGDFSAGLATHDCSIDADTSYAAIIASEDCNISDLAAGKTKFIAGAFDSDITDGDFNAIVGGSTNTVSNNGAFIGGGLSNDVTGLYSAILGGNGGTVSGQEAAVAGGNGLTASGLRSFAAGGGSHTANNTDSAAVGGDGNTASGVNSFVAGGSDNTASNLSAACIGGATNTATRQYSATIGGQANSITERWSVAAGGQGNDVTGVRAIAAGGYFNTIGGQMAGILGGQNNTTSANRAVVLGGYFNTAAHEDGVALGRGALTSALRDFVIGHANAGFSNANNVGFRVAGDTSNVYIGRVDAQHTGGNLVFNSRDVGGETAQISFSNNGFQFQTFAGKRISLQPASGQGFITGSWIPENNNIYDLGESTKAWRNLYLNGGITDGTLTTDIAVITSLRDVLTGITDGDAIFWNGTLSKFEASNPDIEIDHGELLPASLLEDDHTQYMLLAGRLGGQLLTGGTAANDDLGLRSTSNATRGTIICHDHIRSLDGNQDLGEPTATWRDIYMTGEGHGFRMENFTSGTLPGFSASKIGRLMYATDTKNVHVDTGTEIIRINQAKFVHDDIWNGADLFRDYNITAVGTNSGIDDARNCIWELKDASDDFVRVDVEIRATSATNVRVTAAVPLPATSFRLVGVG